VWDKGKHKSLRDRLNLLVSIGVTSPNDAPFLETSLFIAFVALGGAFPWWRSCKSRLFDWTMDRPITGRDQPIMK
jgi:hypothetical protein